MALIGISLVLPAGPVFTVVAAVALMAAVIAAVHHAEVVAHKVGEPFGTLVLAIAVTVIEVALIVSMMLAGGDEAAALPRDTIFAAVMIICNGVVGICLLVGGLRHREQAFRVEGVNAAAAALIAMAGLTLVLPTFTASSPGPTYTVPQLAFASVAALVCCGRRSSSCRPCATATISCRCRTPPTRTCMHRRRRPVSPGRASACCWWRWSR